MIIRNANVYHENGIFETGDIVIQADRITGLYPCMNSQTMIPLPENNDISAPVNTSEASDVLDATGLYAIPGLTDIHFHGCAGYDFSDGSEEAFDAITAYEAAHGITTLCPATMSLPEESLSKICRNYATYRNENGSILCGIHLEGPFLSAKKKGAQKEEYLRMPDIELFHRLNRLSGSQLKLVSLAPELPGSMEFIAGLKDTVVLSLAHTAADYEVAKEAFRNGASHVTHLFNAMPAFAHRDPGIIGAAFDTPDCTVELICDGIHIHPSVIRAAVQMFGKDRITLISDSMMATGLADGIYTLGGQEVTVSGEKAVLADGTIAGSATNLMDCMINAVRNMGISLETAVKAAAVNPARVIGIYDRFGSITPGKYANIVLMNKELEIKAVILKGKLMNTELYK